ncbi:hypothetical protein TNCT6_18360 [Streptomyces sp. 6-11-2]|nr:hypothetical protein TNCT6_18360 [Streptomyces sp. 6-11-2]
MSGSRIASSIPSSGRDTLASVKTWPCASSTALVLLGERINAWDLRRALRRHRPGSGDTKDGWARAARLVMRRAPVFAIAATAGLVLLGLPFLSVKFGNADDRQLPASAESRTVQQHIMDAMVVRSLLVPAVMRLTGRATWWAPGPLRRLHAWIGLSEEGTSGGVPAAEHPRTVVPSGAE